MPFIQNVPLRSIPLGHHIEPGENAMLIQIVDPCHEFPSPKYKFKEVHQFEFLDVEDEKDDGWEFRITQEQANRLVELLQHALNNRMTVLVHCHAGLCRSGAVAEVGIMMGFDDTETTRIPNVLVKTSMMRKLGWTYD